MQARSQRGCRTPVFDKQSDEMTANRLYLYFLFFMDISDYNLSLLVSWGCYGGAMDFFGACNQCSLWSIGTGVAMKAIVSTIFGLKSTISTCTHAG